MKQSSQIRVVFQPYGRIVHVLKGTSILEAAVRAGIVLETPCGSNGTCGKCRVVIVGEASEPTVADKKFFSAKELSEGWRLACQNVIEVPRVIYVPPSSLFGSDQKILTDSESGNDLKTAPFINKKHFTLSHPTLEDDAADLLRLEQAIGEVETELSVIRRLPSFLRQNNFTGTAVLAGKKLIALESTDSTSRAYGIAFDIGTTTIVGQLLDLVTGEMRAVVTGLNPQVRFGDDVLSRINYARTGHAGLLEMQSALIDELRDMINTLSYRTGVGRYNVYEIVFAGNTAMTHILAGINPKQLGEMPFTPVTAKGLSFSAKELGLHINEGGLVYILPVIGGFVGGDTVACMVSAKEKLNAGPALMVDIGTNGEIVLSNDRQYLAASTAAGPAFEGARISCGMRATTGAIEGVVFNDDIKLAVIDNAMPVGICGSGLIDLVAQMLDHGIVTNDGRILRRSELPEGLNRGLAERVQENSNGEVCFVIIPATSGQDEISITQRDVRELQLGCGAIRAGISVLLEEAGVAIEDLKSVLIAGGFGNYINRRSAQRIGLLPHELSLNKIKNIGNAALAGSRAVLLSASEREEGEALACATRHVDLSTSFGFQEKFADSMLFPDL
ncbi:MAG: DUF4445 domain-containing protein [Lentisphaerae bacterium]|nr:DUF4445 domain-containing protein [Lentisphaerota bacterium]